MTPMQSYSVQLYYPPCCQNDNNMIWRKISNFTLWISCLKSTKIFALHTLISMLMAQKKIQISWVCSSKSNEKNNRKYSTSIFYNIYLDFAWKRRRRMLFLKFCWCDLTWYMQTYYIQLLWRLPSFPQRLLKIEKFPFTNHIHIYVYVRKMKSALFYNA